MTIQTKIGGGLNKLQDTLQQGKQKMATVQEASQLRQAIEQLRQSRMEHIIELGNGLHQKIRQGHVQDEEVLEISKKIEELDKGIYEHSKSLEQLQAEQVTTLQCPSCSKPIQASDKFCGHCGGAVELKAEEEQQLKSCHRCEENIIASAAFCPCCGFATQ